MKLYKEFDHFKHSTKLLAYYLRYTICLAVKEKKNTRDWGYNDASNMSSKKYYIKKEVWFKFSCFLCDILK